MKRKFSRILGVGLSVVLLTSLMLVAAPVSALSSASVVLTHATPALADDISQGGVIYTVTFTIGVNLAEGANITLVAPTGTSFATTVGNVANVKMSGTSGLGSAAFSAVNVAGFTGTATNTLVVQVGDVDPGAGPANFIGAGALVQMVILAVVNGPTPSTTNVLTISTATELTGVASAAFTLASPYIPPVAGIVRGFNSSDIKLYEATGNNAISGAFGTGIVKVEVGPGTYDEAGTLTIPAGVTVVSTDGAATTLITDANTAGGGGDVTITGNGGASVLDGFTITEGVNVLAVGATAGQGVTIQNCTISNTGGIALDIDAGSATSVVLSSGNTITAAASQVGIDVATGTVTATSTGGSITLAGTAITAGTGITVTGSGTLTVTGITITGASGTGINLLGNGTLTLTGSSLSNLETAIITGTGATATITANTITACGDATVASLNPTIDIAGVPAAAGVNISGNTIADSPEAILEVNGAGSAVLTFFNFNTITNAAVGIDNLDTSGTVDCTNNYWGASTGPAVVSTATIVKTSPFLRGPVAAGATIYPGVATLTNVAAGLIVTDTGTGWTNAGVALYAGNPGTAAPPVGEVTKYFDVYVNAPNANVVITVLGIQSTGALLYAWSAAQSQWVLVVPQVIDQFQGAVIATISVASIPTLANLAAMEFALVEPAATAASTTPAVTSPTFGADQSSVTPTLIWTAVAGATAYNITVSDEPSFLTPLSTATVEINGYVFDEALDYSTTYYWRVRAVTATVTSGWAMGMFSTMAEPAAAGAVLPDITVEPAEITVEAPPPAAIEVTVGAPPAADVTVEIAPDEIVQVIPDYLLWVIVAVGALLVIALIVLIVRTRRVV